MSRNGLLALGFAGVVLLAVAAIALIGGSGTGPASAGSNGVEPDLGESVVIELLKEPRDVPAFDMVDLNGQTYR